MIWTPNGETDDLELDGDGDVSDEKVQSRRVKAWHALMPLSKELRRISTFGPTDDRDQRLIQAVMELAVLEILSKQKGL